MHSIYEQILDPFNFTNLKLFAASWRRFDFTKSSRRSRKVDNEFSEKACQRLCIETPNE